MTIIYKQAKNEFARFDAAKVVDIESILIYDLLSQCATGSFALTL